MPIHEIRGVTGQVQESWSATLAYDAQNLYVSARGFEPSPLMNSVPDAERKRIFQFGDGFDLHLGLDPKADPNRTEPVPGDIRLILTAAGDKPAVMLYRYRVPNGSGNAVKFTSPVAENVIDEIRDISSEVTMKFRRRGGGSSAWTIEAARPWKILGFPAPAGSSSLRGDVGALVSDPNGMSTVTRYYWANKTNVVMSDLPAESRILPSTWGEFRFATPELGMDDVGGDAPGTDEMLKNLE
jgi:hypothetical protein